MLTENEMNIIAEKYVSEIVDRTSINLIVLYDYTIKKKYGHIYIYTSKEYFETKNDRYALVGNAPFLVENATGKIVVLGTAKSDEYYIKEYEEGRWPNNRR
jgi:hypothetical protein